MAKKNKDTKLSKAAHIKRHTEGTSNELSFSVLDAKKNQVDAEGGLDDKAKTPVFGKVSILAWRPGRKKPPATPTKENALPFSGGDTPSVSPTPAPKQSKLAIDSNSAVEIEKRKTRRKRTRVFSAALGVLVLAALVGGGAYYLYNEFVTHQTQVSLLDQSLTTIDRADEKIVAADEVVNNISNAKIEEIEKVLSSFAEITVQLEEAETLANEALSDMRDSVDKEAAQQAVQATQSRKEMIALAQPLLEAEIKARNDVEEFQEAWNYVLEADAAAREAAEIVTDTTPENVQSSIAKNEEAITFFSEANYRFETIPGASIFAYDVQPILNYIAKRVESLNYAIASDKAILEQNRVEAQTQNDAYTATDEEASNLAKELPNNMQKMVKEAQDVYSAETYEQYKSARQSASAADAFLRDYLGT